MVRVQVLLTEEQDQKLEQLAGRLQTSKAKLVRNGVDFLLERLHAPDSDPLLELIGQAGRAGKADIAKRHDYYLAGLYRKLR